jgi:hypothetical protein
MFYGILNTFILIKSSMDSYIIFGQPKIWMKSENNHTYKYFSKDVCHNVDGAWLLINSQLTLNKHRINRVVQPYEDNSFFMTIMSSPTQTTYCKSYKVVLNALNLRRMNLLMRRPHARCLAGQKPHTTSCTYKDH